MRFVRWTLSSLHNVSLYNVTAERGARGYSRSRGMQWKGIYKDATERQRNVIVVEEKMRWTHLKLLICFRVKLAELILKSACQYFKMSKYMSAFVHTASPSDKICRVY